MCYTFRRRPTNKVRTAPLPLPLLRMLGPPSLLGTYFFVGTLAAVSADSHSREDWTYFFFFIPPANLSLFYSSIHTVCPNRAIIRKVETTSFLLPLLIFSSTYQLTQNNWAVHLLSISANNRYLATQCTEK
ncbi:BA75_03758T0 [Komagataella pastoris]|uniref:BA75_03758T0 n=1 Tax=Komagataella pastoris TaxID=4922 RepID=A0A1B2JEV9_PICPA|nr:BA75_03758T0 [Komagataella pastoris]